MIPNAFFNTNILQKSINKVISNFNVFSKKKFFKKTHKYLYKNSHNFFSKPSILLKFAHILQKCLFCGCVKFHGKQFFLQLVIFKKL